MTTVDSQPAVAAEATNETPKQEEQDETSPQTNGAEGGESQIRALMKQIHRMKSFRVKSPADKAAKAARQAARAAANAAKAAEVAAKAADVAAKAAQDAAQAAIDETNKVTSKKAVPEKTVDEPVKDEPKTEEVTAK